MTLKTAVVAPMPSANETMAVSASPGRFLHSRQENRRSWRRVRMARSLPQKLKNKHVSRELPNGSVDEARRVPVRLAHHPDLSVLLSLTCDKVRIRLLGRALAPAHHRPKSEQEHQRLMPFQAVP